MKNYPFRNLVFQGGGVKALAYHGSLAVLEKVDLLNQIKRVGGTSAGALLAALISMRLSVDEIVQVYQSVDYDRMKALRDTKSQDVTRLGSIQDRMAALNRFVTRFGVYENSYPYEWMGDTIGRFCADGSRATFADFRNLGFRDLHIVTTNVTKRTTEIFCAQATPDVAVVDALLMSQSIPFFYEALQFDGRSFGQGDHYADGGILLNYPIHIFDKRRYVENNRWFVNGVNWETLGCHLYTPAECPHHADEVHNIWSYTQHVVESLMEAQSVAFEASGTSQRRSINISNCCARTTDFGIRPYPDNKTYQQLVAAGTDAAEQFLRTYDPPIIRPFFRHLLDRLHNFIDSK